MKYEPKHNNRMQPDFGKLRFPQPLMRGVRFLSAKYMTDSNEEIVLQFFSRTPWDISTLWEKFLVVLGDELNEMPSKLDANDPLKRNFSDYSLKENAKYICAYGEQESSRTIFGSCPKSECSFSILLCKIASGRNNSLSIYLSQSAGEFAEKLFFRLLDVLSPIYAYCDFQSKISAKKRADCFAVNLEEELLGVFWLTYFCNTYVNHFGHSKFMSLNNVDLSKGSNGVTLRLAGTPKSIGPNLRQLTEETIGKLSFVDPQSTLHKPIGRHVPSYDTFL